MYLDFLKICTLLIAKLHSEANTNIGKILIENLKNQVFVYSLE